MDKFPTYFNDLMNTPAWRWLLAIVVTIVVYIVFNFIFNMIFKKIRKMPYFSNNKAILIFMGIGKFLVFIVIMLLTLDNLGVKVVSLLAGLGIGGIAVALAAQKVLGDLFASVSIILDKPFEVNDLINLDTITGKVESIGVKTTRIRSVTGEQIIVSNSDLLESRVTNFKRMDERRITFGISVSNQTPKENLQEIVAIVKGIIEKQSNVRFDRGHLKGFSAGAVEYEFVFWVTKPEYIVYMDVQEKINLAILDAFDEKNIIMAYPAQKVLLEKT
ncbi:MAG: mechanosensitive ion channel family protein [Fibromonadaceae bacterium]|nr:mechanosensitive ion channel family protein [Fibromonadaceae bacterium]